MIENTLHFGPFYNLVSYFISSAKHPYSVLLGCSILSFILLILISQIKTTTESHNFFVKQIVSNNFFIFLSIVVIFMFRALYFYQDELDPDEGMHLTVALNLLTSPQLWVSADGTTLGPVCQIILLLFSFLFGGISFFLARISATIIIAATFVVLYKSLKINISQTSARLLSLFYVFFLSFSIDVNLQAYNCEIVANLFLALSVYLIFLIKNNITPLKTLLLGLCIGLLPYVKLQTIPIVFILILWSCFVIYKHQFKISLLFFISLILPTLALVIYCSTYKNGISNAIFYYLQNANSHIESSILTREFWTSSANIFTFFSHNFWLQYLFLILPLSGLLFFFFQVRSSKEVIFSILLLIATIFSMLRPLQRFDHYVVFLIIPMIIFCAMIIKSIVGKRKFVPLFLATKIFPLLMIFLYAGMLHTFIGSISGTIAGVGFNLVGTNTYNNYWYRISEIILSLTEPKDSIVVWGWEERLNVYTNLRSATAQNNIERIINDKYNSKNTINYLTDLQKNLPKLIIDVVAPGSFGIVDSKYSLSNQKEIFPFIRENYQLYCKINRGQGDIKIYIRKLAGTTPALSMDESLEACKV